MNLNKWILGVFFSFLFFTIKGQQDNTLFFMHRLPQANFVNPATTIKCKWFVGMPGLSSLHFNEFTSGFSANDFYNSDVTTITLDNAVKGLHNTDLIAADLHAALLHIGYAHKNYYYNFAITEKINTYNSFSRDLLKVAWNGNTQFVGQSANIGDLRVNFNHYREYAFGVSKEVNERLRIGAKLKLLYGKSNIYTPKTNGYLSTDEDDFSLSFNFKGTVKSSLPVNILQDEDGLIAGMELQEDVDWYKYAMNTKNKGYGLDLGFIYELNETTVLSGSLLDLGWISWKTDTNILESSGNLDVAGSGNTSGFETKEYLDEQIEAMRLSFVPSPFAQKYSSNLVPHLYLGITRDLFKSVNAGFLFHSEIYRNRLYPSYTLSANTQFFKTWAASLSYTIQNTQFNQLGLGIGGKIGPVHLHVMSDNFTGLFNLTGARNSNIRFGIGFLLGCSEKQEDNDKGGESFSCFGDPYHSVNTKQYRKNMKRYRGRIRGSSRKRYRK